MPNGHKIYQHLPFKGSAKFTQIGILSLKTNHLATLSATVFGQCYFLTGS
jgi:hypothetical protein